MSEIGIAKIGADEAKQKSFTTSFGKCEYPAFRENNLLGIIVKLFVVVQILLELRHLRHIVRFATNISFETIIHFSLYKLCKTFEISHSVINVLDWFFYMSMMSLGMKMFFGLLNDTAVTIERLFSKEESAEIDKTDKVQKL